jgi:hypothetical protein
MEEAEALSTRNVDGKKYPESTLEPLDSVSLQTRAISKATFGKEVSSIRRASMAASFST